jgi:hypothetical protein
MEYYRNTFPFLSVLSRPPCSSLTVSSLHLQFVRPLPQHSLPLACAGQGSTASTDPWRRPRPAHSRVRDPRVLGRRPVEEGLVGNAAVTWWWTVVQRALDLRQQRRQRRGCEPCSEYQVVIWG